MTHYQSNLLFAFIILLRCLAFADFSGRVVVVTDGDTIKVMYDGKG